MNPFFSIVLPTYNRAHLISKAVESVINQTFSNWELVIVDDGSTDNTREVTESFSDNRIKYIFQQNAERSAARNNGIKNSAGAYICFLDSDDYYLPNRLELLYGELQKHNFSEAVFYTGLLIEKDGRLTERKEKEPLQNIYDHLATAVIHSQQTCIHRKILNAFLFDVRFHVGEDMELWLRIAAKFPFVFIPSQHTVVIIDHEERTVNVKKYNSYLYLLPMLKYIFSKKHPGKNISKKLQKETLSYCYFGIAKYHIYTEKKLSGLKWLVCSVLADRSNTQTKFKINLILKLITKYKSQEAIKLLQ